MPEEMSYSKAGVNIDVADAAKREMGRSLESSDNRVLNRIGAFATLFDGRFPTLEHPVLILKTEEPGSKQKLAFQHGRVSSICYDVVNHLINDIIVMGARPLSVQDAIICGKLEKDVVTELVRAMSQACRDQDCTLTGGETSEQPGVLEPGIYVLVASIVGVVEKAKIIDGARIAEGDIVLAVASNGLHTNGYSLVRALMAQNPELAETPVAGQSFLDAILTPHQCYYQALRELFDSAELHGMAHITGGGIQGNLPRILPPHLNAAVDLARIQVLPVFKTIRHAGNINDAEMLRTFNLGVGLTVVAALQAVESIQSHLASRGCDSYPIGTITAGDGKVVYEGTLEW